MAEIKRRRDDVESKLIKGSGGQFEVVADGKLIFSKKQSGRFPDPEEILAGLPV